MNNFELAELVRAARLRAYGCPVHGRHVIMNRCQDCQIEAHFHISMTPVSRILGY